MSTFEFDPKFGEGTLHYWPIKAKNCYATLAIANAGGMKIVLDGDGDSYLVSHESSLPFGQVPYFEHSSGVNFAQSGAILRFVSRKVGLQGDSDADYAKSEMLIEESFEIFTALGKANYAPNRSEEFSKIFAEYFN